MNYLPPRRIKFAIYLRLGQWKAAGLHGDFFPRSSRWSKANGRIEANGLLLSILGANLALFSFSPLAALDPFASLDQKKMPDFSQKEEKKIKRRSTLSDIPEETLKADIDKCLQQGKKYEATKYLEHLVSRASKDHCNLLLTLADLYFDQQEFSKAEKAYDEFILLYPGHQKFEEAKFRFVQSGSKITLDPERDQTKTQEVLKAAQEFLKNPLYTQYRTEVETIVKECRQKLLESEIDRFNFYLKRNSFKAAHGRLDIIFSEYKPQFSLDMEPTFLHLKYRLARAENNIEQLLRTQWDLLERFPDHAITQQLGITMPTLQLAFQTHQITLPESSTFSTTLTQATSASEPKKFVDRF